MVKLQAIGHLGKDCVINQVNGKTVMNFSVAHSEKFKDNAGVEREKTLWVNCSWWNDRTNVAQYLKKGTQVYVEGVPDVGTYQDGQHRTVAQLKLRVMSVQLLGGKAENGSAMVSETSTSTKADDDFNDLPF